MESNKKLVVKAKILRSKPNMEKSIDREILWFDHLNSENLDEIEKGIREFAFTKGKIDMAQCMAFHRISKLQLFKQRGCKNMTEYIRTQTIVPRSTAVQYQYIGQLLEDKANLFRGAGYLIEEGVGKLRYFPRNFDSFSKDKQTLVLEHLKEDSTVTFRDFLKQLKGEKVVEKQKKEFLASDYLKSKKEEILSGVKFLDKAQYNTLSEYLDRVFEEIGKQVKILPRGRK